MRETGFQQETTGPSVRFVPPDESQSITFYKRMVFAPHPDPSIPLYMRREFAKKLNKNYGWTEADFLPEATE
ncbi:hypothetical protein B0H11DRAFT_2387828 [Mycena galericulata]|nr:hypothetical protein B0H11DRAFT_2387828 [Mycena galericulata]